MTEITETQKATAAVLRGAGLALIACTIYQSYVLPDYTQEFASYFLYIKNQYVARIFLGGIFRMVAPVLLLLCAVALTASPLLLQRKRPLFINGAYLALTGVAMVKFISLMFLVGYHKPIVEWLKAANKYNQSPEVLSAFTVKFLGKLYVIDMAVALVALALIAFVGMRHNNDEIPIDIEAPHL